ncbi:MAG: Holliday junction resolvase RuvX [Proteobacteria bacterium]|nr:Holliday junction resolvase RuvX [Pseudomonadota bacterium]MCH9757788.1 Holliday junction resolvase RuvX [Pseudomonadota bacterium]
MLSAVLSARKEIIFAFDVGRKKTGIALGNSISGIARPLAIVEGERAQQLAKITDYITQWQPGTLVVGLPLHMDGSTHRMTDRARRYADALQAQFSLPVEFADERQSSQFARQQGEGGAIDDRAAAIILQDWLDQQKTEK